MTPELCTVTPERHYLQFETAQYDKSAVYKQFLEIMPTAKLKKLSLASPTLWLIELQEPWKGTPI